MLRASLAAIAACLIVTPASLHAQGHKATAVNRAADTPAAFTGAEYWTPERRAQTKPLMWNEDPRESGDLAALAIRKRPRAVAGGLPDADADLRALQDFPFEWRERGAAAEEQPLDSNRLEAKDFSLAGRDVFSSFPANKEPFLQFQYPYRAIGKLLFDEGYCTASVISPNDVIVTAAHCCYDRRLGRWNTNFAFVPAAADNFAPFGVFPYVSARILIEWIDFGTRKSDVCVLTLHTNEVGERVTFYTGSLGRSWNWPAVQHHFAFGYPGNIDDAQFLQTCTSESFGDEDCGGFAVLHTGCDMTEGSSGGPWLRVYRPFESGEMNYVNSVVSGWDGCSGPRGGVFNGARFTSDNIEILCQDEGC